MESGRCLTVVGAVREADAGAAEDEEGADLERRPALGGRGFWISRCVNTRFATKISSAPAAKPTKGLTTSDNDRRTCPALAQFAPVARLPPVADRRREPDAEEDRSDQGVRTQRGQAEEPGPEIPDNGGGKQREHHREAGVANLRDEQVDGRQVHDAKATTRPVVMAWSTPRAFQRPDQATATPGRSDRV